ncbi:MAG: sugar porter family MFS transporter [Gammaproteobacteria bacterium]|nr:sugar porter family MFS transporter [Gammaproteobacteria bacterium]
MYQSENRFSFVLITAVAALSGILFGYDTGVISGAILFIRDEFHLSAWTNGVVVSAVLGGALLGALASGQLVDHLGRKRLLIADAIIFILGTLVSAMAMSVPLLIVGRMAVGIAIGIASYVAPLYISEIAPARYRGVLVSLNQLAITLGILLSYLVDYFFVSHGGWRWMFAAGIVPALGLLFGMLFLPKSPRWLCSKKRFDDALHILKRIHGANRGEKEFSEIQKSLQQHHGTWKMLFDPMIKSTIVIGIGLAIIQQVTGINTIIYYAPTIFNLAGFDGPSNAILATMSVGVVFVVSTLVALPLIDTLGRRPLLLLGLFGMTISLAALSFAFSGTEMTSFLKWTALTSMLVYIASFGVSLGPIMWLMIAEIYPLKVRGLGCSLATAANWGANMFVALTFLSLIQQFGTSHTFLIYSLLSVMSILFVFFLVPETKAITLEQIESNLRAGLRYRKLGNVTI